MTALLFNKTTLLILVLFTVAISSCRTTLLTSTDRVAKDLEVEFSYVECNSEKRLEAVKKNLLRHGLEYEIEKFERATNISVKAAGGSETVVVGAHYDKTSLGCGAIDNWTGVVVLTRLAKHLSSKKMEKSYKFVAFDAEEKGLWGSRAMVDALSPEANVCAMVNLDSLGIDDTWALKPISTRPMLMLAAETARERGDSLSIREYKGAVSDSLSFKNAGIPAITFSGIGDDWRDYLHREADQIKKIDNNKVADSYFFVEAFLERLDKADCSTLREAK